MGDFRERLLGGRGVGDNFIQFVVAVRWADLEDEGPVWVVEMVGGGLGGSLVGWLGRWFGCVDGA